ncbi:MAG: gamma carbonic anhydrase family protein [Alphaproteobacteria bacterium]|nr:gamma carbonic anhydrase family protein [Alphaproteobacteria bacterium]
MTNPCIGPDVKLLSSAFVHPSACLYGDITIGEGASVWPNVVMRAEVLKIVIGPNSNIQDFTMIHIGDRSDTVVGANCSITHHVTLHGCTIGDNCLIGIGATIMDGCIIGENSIVAGGTFLKERTVIPPNSIVMGMPGKVTRTRNNALANAFNAFMYRKNAEGFARGDYRVWASDSFRAEADAERTRLAALHGEAGG